MNSNSNSVSNSDRNIEEIINSEKVFSKGMRELCEMINTIIDDTQFRDQLNISEEQLEFIKVIQPLAQKIAHSPLLEYLKNNGINVDQVNVNESEEIKKIREMLTSDKLENIQKEIIDNLTNWSVLYNEISRLLIMSPISFKGNEIKQDYKHLPNIFDRNTQTFTLNLADLLITPVQRGPRYVLLYNDMKSLNSNNENSEKRLLSWKSKMSDLNETRRRVDDLAKINPCHYYYLNQQIAADHVQAPKLLEIQKIISNCIDYNLNGLEKALENYPGDSELKKINDLLGLKEKLETKNNDVSKRKIEQIDKKIKTHISQFNQKIGDRYHQEYLNVVFKNELQASPVVENKSLSQMRNDSITRKWQAHELNENHKDFKDYYHGVIKLNDEFNRKVESLKRECNTRNALLNKNEILERKLNDIRVELSKNKSAKTRKEQLNSLKAEFKSKINENKKLLKNVENTIQKINTELTQKRRKIVRDYGYTHIADDTQRQVYSVSFAIVNLIEELLHDNKDTNRLRQKIEHIAKDQNIGAGQKIEIINDMLQSSHASHEIKDYFKQECNRIIMNFEEQRIRGDRERLDLVERNYLVPSSEANWLDKTLQGAIAGYQKLIVILKNQNHFTTNVSGIKLNHERINKYQQALELLKTYLNEKTPEKWALGEHAKSLPNHTINLIEQIKKTAKKIEQKQNPTGKSAWSLFGVFAADKSKAKVSEKDDFKVKNRFRH